MTNPTPPNQPSAEALEFADAWDDLPQLALSKSEKRALAELFDAHTQALRDRVAELLKIRALCIRSLVQAIGCSTEAIEEGPLTQAIKHAKEVARLRSDLEATRAERDEAKRLLGTCRYTEHPAYPHMHHGIHCDKQEPPCGQQRPCVHDREEK